MTLKDVLKHLPGKHSQATHGKGKRVASGSITRGDTTTTTYTRLPKPPHSRVRAKFKKAFAEGARFYDPRSLTGSRSDSPKVIRKMAGDTPTTRGWEEGTFNRQGKIEWKRSAWHDVSRPDSTWQPITKTQMTDEGF